MLLRLMELVVLVAELSQRTGRRPEELDKELVLRGYSPHEIEQAMFWYSSQGDYRDGRGAVSGNSRSVRVLSEFERMSLSSDCFGFLLRLQNLGIIDSEQFERIIARAIPVGPEKTELGDLKAIACSVIFDREVEDLEDAALDFFDDGAAAS